jgi:hypothetical protein
MHNPYYYLAIILLLLASSCKKDAENKNTDICERTVVNVTSDINTPTVWEDCHTYVISVNQVSVTSSLTILPGAVVKFKDIASDNAILVSNSGTIIAKGTSDNPVVFTSYKDDANGGDTNGDGTSSSPAQDDWGGIIINSDNCEFTSCKFLYGGKGPDAGTGQPTLEFSHFFGIIDSCTFAYCGGETTYNGYGVVDARSCNNRNFSITNSVFYGCIKPLFLNPFISIDNSNVFHNPSNSSEKNKLNGIFITDESNEATMNVSWTETEVPFVLTGSLYIGDGLKLTLANDVIIKVATLPYPGYNKISIKEGRSIIEGHDLGGVYFTSYFDDTKGGDTNGDGNATTPSNSDWYGIQDISATLATNNNCYSWSNILFAQYP